MDIKKQIFQIASEEEFNTTVLRVFRFQAESNPVYREYITSLGVIAGNIRHFTRIPAMPVEFFRTRTIVSGKDTPEKTFISSGTTGNGNSRHPVLLLELYRESLMRGFRYFYGSPEEYEIFALVPSPDTRPDSSLVFMAGEWIRSSGSERSGFFLEDFPSLAKIFQQEKPAGKKRLLIGLTYALVDFAEKYPRLPGIDIVMETGGMKGRRKEMIREELHAYLKEQFAVEQIHSEYGMTEMLSQAYSKGNGLFGTPPWLKILIRDPNDPFSLLPPGKTGGITVIDLANIYSCSFIATQDLGRLQEEGRFEVMGRFDYSDIRGCNLMIG
jgi:hypothetical protein